MQFRPTTYALRLSYLDTDYALARNTTYVDHGMVARALLRNKKAVGRMSTNEIGATVERLAILMTGGFND